MTMIATSDRAPSAHTHVELRGGDVANTELRICDARPPRKVRGRLRLALGR